MPDPWMPGAVRDPGTGAGYNAGFNNMTMAVDHSTDGTNSIAICRDGRAGYDSSLCNMLFPKSGPPHQFAEINAKTYHAGSPSYGDYNGYGPGFEVERLWIPDQQAWEPLTEDQIHWIGEAFRWCESEWGLPFEHYWGPQFAWWEAMFNGHVNHSQIHPNNDGFTQDEWNSIKGAKKPEEPQKKDDLMKDVVYHNTEAKGKDGEFVMFFGDINANAVNISGGQAFVAVTNGAVYVDNQSTLAVVGEAITRAKARKAADFWAGKV